MKLQLSGLQGSDSLRNVTDALLQVDLGARINFEPDAQRVRIEGRMTLDDAAAAITRAGVRVAGIVDGTIRDAGFRWAGRGGPAV
jgi:hypothetical protein